jgi:hypothetical protein
MRAPVGHGLSHGGRPKRTPFTGRPSAHGGYVRGMDQERTYQQGLTDAADLVEGLWHTYSDPAARAALGLAMDRIRELAAEG